MEHLTNFILFLAFAISGIYAKIINGLSKIFPGLFKGSIERIFRYVGDITINGSGLSDIQVLKPDKFYARIAAYLDLGFAEGYMDQEWTCKDLVGLFSKIFNSNAMNYLYHPICLLTSHLNLQTGDRVWEVGRVHYDKGNDLYEAMLDTHMQYTCGYWRNATHLNEAQLAKMDLIAAKLQLKPGMRVLDLGCGFGTLACYLAKMHGVSVVGCTISKEQLRYGQRAAEGLPVDLRLCDYRDIDEKFDRVLSIGITEHVGPKNYRTLMRVVHRCLADDGLYLMHTIGCNHKSFLRTALSVHTYIFPNGQIPYYLEIAKAAEDLFIIEDWHNFGFDYTKTLAAWRQNFEDAWPTLKHKYDDRFYRMWILYLCQAEALFVTRKFQLWQIVFSKDGLKGGYVSVR